MICTDHWPGSLFGTQGREDIMTPTLDFLIENGVKFENFYSECPVCIPARRSLMTGLSPKAHGDRVYSDRMEMPNVPTLAQTFRDNGYQAYAVGKLHVFPQRNRIGFDDAILSEEGRYEFGIVDDYQIWLGEQGYPGQEFMHSMGNNTYLTRPWHLPEYLHPTNWVTMEMMKAMKRKDPTRPAFFFCSYQFPHPPLVPLQTYLDMYDDVVIEEPIEDTWHTEEPLFALLGEDASRYSKRERERARKAFYAQCTHIDSQIRLLIGTLRETNLLNDTIIVFMSDHGDMLFDHKMVAKRCFYESASCVPMVFTGAPMGEYRGKGFEQKLGKMSDVMPTLLDLCGLEIPHHVEGIPLFSQSENPYIYGEVGEGVKATRMIRTSDFKLIWYPCDNTFQLFDMKKDRNEVHDLSTLSEFKQTVENLKKILLDCCYGSDLDWIEDKEFVGFNFPGKAKAPDFGLYNQRGYHWPAPTGYSNVGKNA